MLFESKQQEMKQFTAVLSLILVAVLLTDGNGGRTGRIIDTSTGKVRGAVSLSRQHREFYSWRGIPYAEPPVGNLRFAVSD